MNNTANEYEMITRNKRIWSYYNENKSVNFESANLLLIDFMENIFNNMSNDLSTNINSQLLSYMNENKTQIDNIKSNINLINENVTKLNTDITNNMMLQLMTIKKDYIEDVRQIITNNTLTTNEKIGSLIDKNNSHLIDKTTLIINESIPKSQEQMNNKLQENFKQLHTLITEDTNKLAKSINNEDSLNDFINKFEIKYQSMMQTIQQPLYSFFTASEDRINKNIETLKESNSNSVQTQNKVFDELNDFLGKYKASSNKGKFGEHQLSSVLNNLYSNAEINNTSGIKASGDIIMKRMEKPNILFENKDYTYNIPKEEIEKFIRDVDGQNMNGIFISQYSGIAFKQNFQIDINKGKVLIYIQNCEYSADKIRLAVDIIDNLYSKLQDINYDNENNTISTEILADINTEYQTYISQKDNMITFLKDFHKKMTMQIEDLRLPVLDKYLESHFAYVKTRCFVCDICNSYTAGTKQSVSAHKRGCVKKQHHAMSPAFVPSTLVTKPSAPITNSIIINTKK